MQADNIETSPMPLIIDNVLQQLSLVTSHIISDDQVSSSLQPSQKLNLATALEAYKESLESAREQLEHQVYLYEPLRRLLNTLVEAERAPWIQAIRETREGLARLASDVQEFSWGEEPGFTRAFLNKLLQTHAIIDTLVLQFEHQELDNLVQTSREVLQDARSAASEVASNAEMVAEVSLGEAFKGLQIAKKVRQMLFVTLPLECFL